jgi:mono/diheme cytochrome c family protein
VLARATRRALNGLPDDLLTDIGLTRSDIPFVVDAIASGDAQPRRSSGPRLALAAVIVVSACVIASHAVLAQETQVKRGQYLVTLGGCTDCHTPGYFFGKPDMARFLGGSEVGFEIPGLGVFHGPNLTPDRETGLGKWSTQEIANAVTKGQRPDGRILAPIMPWHAFANLTGEDVGAIVAFLKSLPPVGNKVPGPFGPNATPTSFVMKIVPPQSAATAGPVPK